MMDEPIVIIRVPALGIEKTAAPELLEPARKDTTIKKSKQNELHKSKEPATSAADR